MYCIVWHAEPEHNITCRMKSRGQTLTSTGMSGPFNRPPLLVGWFVFDVGVDLTVEGLQNVDEVPLSAPSAPVYCPYQTFS